jgi:uncharacterized protein
MPRPEAGARWRALLAGVLILALLAASPSAAEEASPAPVLSWQTGAGQSHLIPALEVGGFVFGLNQSASRTTSSATPASAPSSGAPTRESVAPWASEGRRTMSETNGAIIRKAYDDFARGNIPAVFAAFDPTITWHVPGHSPLSGDFAGHDQVGGFFQRTLELSGGAFSIDVHHVLADDDLVVALTTVNARRNGVSASFPEVHVWRLKNGKATEFREYQGDEQREDRFWS